MSIVIIEGTEMPCAYLDTGRRRRVTLTPFITTLVSRGFVRILEQTPAPLKREAGCADCGKKEPPLVPEESVTEVAQPPVGPGRNASREVWRDFLTDQGMLWGNDYTRDQLVALWYGD